MDYKHLSARILAQRHTATICTVAGCVRYCVKLAGASFVFCQSHRPQQKFARGIRVCKAKYSIQYARYSLVLKPRYSLCPICVPLIRQTLGLMSAYWYFKQNGVGIAGALPKVMPYNPQGYATQSSNVKSPYTSSPYANRQCDKLS